MISYQPGQPGARMADAGTLPAHAPAAAPGAAPLEGVPAIPEDALILITTRNLVLFPGTVLPITLGRQRSIVAAQTAIRLSRPVGLVL
jgi:ATP-dependent Lon protease